MKYPARFAASFVLLGLLTALAAAGFVLGLTNSSSKASKASVRAITNPTRDSAVKAACEENVKQAASAGVIVKSCKLAPGHSFQQKGDTAQLVLLVSDGATNFTVVTTLSKGVWQLTNLQVVDAKPAKK